jgi:ribosomal protein S18 acetylase RimI-like enzyme
MIPGISLAGPADIPKITALLNSAYRGEQSTKGWTTEAYLIAGERRTDEEHLLEVMEKPGSIFLKYILGDNDIIGCVNLQQQGSKLYLGMLGVSPDAQGGGIGKKLLQAADIYAKQTGSQAIYMTVISVRTELIDWYKRHGYMETGEFKPFPEDTLTGKHLQPLEFMVLQKLL